ncbi:MAG: HAD family phosphatase [Ruminococcaceae bacterium]|nr:HAD family phosphatase [Oscillospiraceae bacterium]
MFEKAVILDMDGTILDSMPAWENVGGDYLRSHGVTPPDGFVNTVRAMSFEESSRYMVDEFSLPVTYEELMQAIFDAVANKYRHQLLLKPDAGEFVRALHQNGIPVCIATATNIELAKAAMERLNMTGYLEFILSCDEVGSGKERPDVFLEAARRMGVCPQDTWVFEDSLMCIRTAKGAGFRTVGIWDAASSGNWEEICRVADRAVKSFDELLV